MPAHPQPNECPEPSDIALMLRVKEGDEGAFLALVRRYQDALFRFFRSMGLTSDAEDAAQETFVRLYKYRQRYEPRAGLRTFIYLLARQVFVDAYRKRQRYDGFLTAFQAEAEGGQSEEARVGAPLVRAEELLRELPEPMRLVVVMSFYEGLNYEEIADVLEVPVGTVKSRMFHALRRLREAMNEQKSQR
jgi:RNA polymerase sigma-70 factor, ECF subfamily